MSILNRIVDKVYVINMDSQPDRMKRVDEVLRSHGIVYTRFSAVNGANVKASKFLTPNCNRFCPDGMKGCALSHRGIWTDMVQKGYTSVLVLEDDVSLDPVFFETFQRGWNSVPKDFDVLWLGCNFIVNDTNVIPRLTTGILFEKPTPLNEHVVKTACGVGTHGYIITRTAAELFVKQPIPWHIDAIMAGWIKEFGLNSYALSDLPVKAGGELSFSSTLSEKFPTGLNTLLHQIPGSNTEKLDWILGENFLKLGPFTINALVILFALLVLFTPKSWTLFYAVWLGAEFLLSRDGVNAAKYGLILAMSYGLKSVALFKGGRSRK